jgi:hypothetical protein
MNLDDDKETDFFEDEVPDPVKEEKKPVYTPDDPRYWEQPEDPFSHLTPSAAPPPYMVVGWNHGGADRSAGGAVCQIFRAVCD